MTRHLWELHVLHTFTSVMIGRIFQRLAPTPYVSFFAHLLLLLGVIGRVHVTVLPLALHNCVVVSDESTLQALGIFLKAIPYRRRLAITYLYMEMIVNHMNISLKLQ